MRWRRRVSSERFHAELKRLNGLLEDYCPPNYDAHRDPLADKWDHEEAVNKLGAGLRDALQLLANRTKKGER